MNKGKLLTLTAIGLIFTVLLINLFISFNLYNLFIVVLLWLIYKGYNWAKVVILVHLFFGIILGLYLISSQSAPSTVVFVWTVITIVSFTCSTIILLFSKSVSEYMQSKREQNTD